MPDEIKIAKIIPIFKAGSNSEFSNYRPISVLPGFSKIYEKIFCIRINKFLESNNIISPNQYGFRKKALNIYGIIGFS